MPVSLEDAMSFLYGAGEVVQGWSGERSELVQAAQQRFPGKPYCLVKRWILVDLTTSGTEPVSAEIPPMFVFAHEVIYDSRQRFAPGYWVRSSYGISTEPPRMFETRNTVYLLMGDGYRKQASSETYSSLFP